MNWLAIQEPSFYYYTYTCLIYTIYTHTYAHVQRRDSIIPLGGPDYKNVGYDEDGQLNIDGELIPKTHNYENQVISTDKDTPGAGGAAAATENTFYNPGLYDPDMDYMNQDPEGLFHTYTNQDDLLQQVSREQC